MRSIKELHFFHLDFLIVLFSLQRAQQAQPETTILILVASSPPSFFKAAYNHACIQKNGAIRMAGGTV